MEIIDFTKITGILICYTEEEEMQKVYARLIDLKQKEPGLKGVAIAKAYNINEGIPSPWTLALIVTDEQKFKSMDDYLTDGNVDLGKNIDMYSGALRVKEFFRMVPLNGKYVPGIVRIKSNKCPLGATVPISCQFCMYGHMLECHHPMTCDEAECDHLAKYKDE